MAAVAEEVVGVDAAGVVVENNEQKQQQGVVGTAALAPSMLPPCMGDDGDDSSMLRLAGHGEWAEVGGRLRWVDPSVPCVTPIRYARAGGE